jgi:hypothetical protein
MRELENSVKSIILPLITGDQTRRYLGKREQRIMAAWVALKVIVQEYGPDSDRIAHHTQLRRLWKRQLAPEMNWRIWIAQFDSANASTLWTTHPMLLVPDAVARRRKSDLATYFNSQAATYVIGKLFIHIVRSPYKRLVREFRFHPNVTRKLGVIWPWTGYDIGWPLEPLTDTEAGYVAWAVRSLVKRGGELTPSWRMARHRTLSSPNAR